MWASPGKRIVSERQRSTREHFRSQFARSKSNAYGRWRVRLGLEFLKRNRPRVSIRFFSKRGHFCAKGKFSISSATGRRTHCGERAADDAVGLCGQAFVSGAGTCSTTARGEHELRAHRRKGRANRRNSVYHSECVENRSAVSAFR